MKKFNLYTILSVIFVGLLAFRFVSEFGPIKKAEKSALEEGKVLHNCADPLLAVACCLFNLGGRRKLRWRM